MKLCFEFQIISNTIILLIGSNDQFRKYESEFSQFFLQIHLEPSLLIPELGETVVVLEMKTTKKNP